MESGGRTKFLTLVVAAQAVGVAAVIFMAVWMGNFQGGFGWGYDLRFNYHPLFMVIGMVYIYGNAIMVYRVFRNENKTWIKVLHMVMQLSAFGFAVAALVSVFSTHNHEGFANLYSVHSWVGLATVTMFGFQFLFGFVFYLYPQLSESWKVRYMSAHRFWGVTIFCMAIATALLGTVENTGFKVGDYSKRTSESYIINFMGVFLIVFGWIVTYIVHKPEYKRETSNSEYTEQLQED